MVVDTRSNISIVRPDILRRSASAGKVNVEPVNDNVRTVAEILHQFKEKRN